MSTDRERLGQHQWQELNDWSRCYVRSMGHLGFTWAHWGMWPGYKV